MGNSIQYELDTACKQGDLQTVKRILEQPGDTPSLMIPVWNACQNGDLEVVKYLFQDKYKNRVNQELIVGKGFFNACTGRHLDIAHFLLEQDEGRTLNPHSVYKFAGCPVAVDLLIKNEPDRKLAIEIAWDKSKYDVVGYLSDKKF